MPADGRAAAAGALHNVSSGPTHLRGSVLEAGGLAVLLALLRSSATPQALQAAAVSTLDNLAAFSAANRRAISDAGGLSALLRLLGCGGGGGGSVSVGDALAEAVLCALESLSHRFPAASAAIVAAGGVRALQRLAAGSRDAGVRAAAVAVLQRLQSPGQRG